MINYHSRAKPIIPILVTLAFLLQMLSVSSVGAQAPSADWYEVRSIYTKPWGITNPFGVAYLAASNQFTALDAPKAGQTTTGFALVPFYKQPPVASNKSVAITDPLNFAYSQRDNSYWSFDRATSVLIGRAAQGDGTPSAQPSFRFDAHSLGLQNPQGMAFDPKSGMLFILDANSRRIAEVFPDAQGHPNPINARATTQIDLRSLGNVQLRGVAFNPQNGHLYTIGAVGPTLFEVTNTGVQIATRDLSGLKTVATMSMLFAPTADNFDDPANVDLYIADPGKGTVGGRVAELSLLTTAPTTTAPSGAAPLAAAAAATPTNYTLINTIQTWQWATPSTDPSGIAYQPSSGQLIVADSEIEEAPAPYWHGFNMFVMNTAGTLLSNFTTFTSNPTNNTKWNNYSNEPAGIALNPTNGHLFVSDDVLQRVFEVNPGNDGKLGTSDDVITSFSASAFGDVDAEDVAYANGILYLSCGTCKRVFVVNPGPNGKFDGIAPAGDDTVTSFDVSAFGVRDTEGLGYDPVSGNLLVVDKNRYLVETTTSGALVTTFDLKPLNVQTLADAEVAPSSVNPAVNSIYIVDRMVDNNVDPNENDGRIYEYSVNGAPPPPTPTPTNTPLPATPTNTPLPPTPTNTPLPATPTNTPLPATPTNTPLPPTPTNTPLPATPTNTPLPATPTNTPLPATPTNTPLPATPTNTPLPATPTNTPLPPTATNTPLPPTPTNTPLPPTPTNTPLPPTPTNTPLPTATSTPAPANLMANPGFELDVDNNGKPDGWTGNAAFTRSTDIAHSGTYSGKHSSTAGASYNVTQTITPVTPGTTYKFSGWVNIPSTTGAFSFTLDVRWRDSTGANLTTNTIKTYTAQTAGWDQATGSFVAPANAASALVRMVVSTLNGTIYVDDFSFGQ